MGLRHNRADKFCFSDKTFLRMWPVHNKVIFCRDKIHPMQFGCLKGKFTSYCLLDMVHN